MRSQLAFLVILLFLSSCTKEENSELRIRVSNVSSSNFENIVVNTSTGEVGFGDLDPGQQSAYKVFDLAYRYAFVELEIEGDTFTLQPIDYVGESTLPDGEYTYAIGADDSQDRFTRLTLTLITD